MSLAKLLLAAEGARAGSDSCMIYLAMPPELLPPDLPVQPAHITIVYLGHITPAQFQVACDRARAAAKAMPPLHGRMGGLGIFDPSVSSGGKRVAYAPVTVDGIYQLQHALRDMAAPESHPFRPHVTLAYLGPDDPDPPPVTSASLCFSQLYVRRGTDTRAYAFEGHHLPHPHGGRHQPPVNTGVAQLSYPSALERVLAFADSCCGVGLAPEAPRSASIV